MTYIYVVPDLGKKKSYDFDIVSGFQLIVCNINQFSYFSIKTYVVSFFVSTQKNCLNETVLLST